METGRREGIHTAVAKDVTDIFKGKSSSQLVALQSNIEKKIAARQEGVDISYWESLLSQLKAHIARARLRDRHQENLRRKLDLLKAQQGLIKQDQEDNDAAAAAASSASAATIEAEPTDDNMVAIKEEPVPMDDDAYANRDEIAIDEDEEGEEESAENRAENDLLEPCLSAYESGRYSPAYLTASQVLEAGQLVYTEEDDGERLEEARARVQGRNPAAAASGSSSSMTLDEMMGENERAMRGEAQKGMSADEAIFSVESTIDKPVYLWSDKYRPRKPRYFNRVHTGFEWNKYNQTHYDMDNPPPKIVQGYKFNIFYPDLIDKNSTPQYTVMKKNKRRRYNYLMNLSSFSIE